MRGWGTLALLWGCSQRPLYLPEADRVIDLAAPDLADPIVDLALSPPDLAAPVAVDLAADAARPPDLALATVRFGTPKRLFAGAQLGTLTVADFDGDRVDDLVMVSPGSGTVVTFLGDRAQPLERTQRMQIMGVAVSGTGVIDLDHDGHLDLLVVVGWQGPATVEWLRGKGDGSFEQSGSFPAGQGAFVSFGVGVGDFDGDQRPDLVLNSSQGEWRVLLQTPDGGLGPPLLTPGDNNSAGPLVADFDGDGRLDVVSMLFGPSPNLIVHLWPGDGKGAFAAAQTASTEAGRIWQVGDLDGDGVVDLVAGHLSSLFHAVDGAGTVSVLRGLGGGKFAPAVRYSSGSSPSNVVLADFNGDGRLDVATGNYVDGPPSDPTPVRVCRGAGDTTLLPCEAFATGEKTVFGMAAGDFDGNGRADVVTGLSNNNSVGELILLRSLP